MLLFSSIFFWLVNPNLSVSSSNSKSIFILAGQSNMAGRGGVLNDTSTGIATWDAVVPAQCGPDPAILRLDAHLRWVEAREPLHLDVDFNKTCGVGPGMAFAHWLFGQGTAFDLLGLVPCAVGGTTISQWARGMPLYRQMIERARASVGDGGTIEAVLWYQGESDTVNQTDAVSYGRKLERFLLDLRADLQDPMLPIFLVAIASGEGPFLEKVREAQLGINLPNVRVVDAKGLPLAQDNLHLTTAAQIHLGEMLGRAYLKFLPGPIQRSVAHNVSPSGFHLARSHTYWTFISGVTFLFIFLMWKAVKKIRI